LLFAFLFKPRLRSTINEVIYTPNLHFSKHFIKDARRQPAYLILVGFTYHGKQPTNNSHKSLKSYASFEKVDFSVVVDMFMTPTAQQADIVPPAASWLETDDIADIHFFWCYTLRQKVTQVGECWDDKEILIQLAKKLELEKDFPWKDWLLKDAGINFDQFKNIGILKGEMRYRKYEQIGFNTPSKKFEFYSTLIKSLGFDPLPHAKIPSEYLDPELAREYPQY